jgi:hypothetical protein
MEDPSAQTDTLLPVEDWTSRVQLDGQNYKRDDGQND